MFPLLLVGCPLVSLVMLYCTLGVYEVVVRQASTIVIWGACDTKGTPENNMKAVWNDIKEAYDIIDPPSRYRMMIASMFCSKTAWAAKETCKLRGKAAELRHFSGVIVRRGCTTCVRDQMFIARCCFGVDLGCVVVVF